MQQSICSPAADLVSVMYLTKGNQNEISKCLCTWGPLSIPPKKTPSHPTIDDKPMGCINLHVPGKVNPRPVRAFLITRTVRGGGVGTSPPWRSAPDGRRASRKKPVDAPRRDLAIAHIVFSPRSTVDLVRSGQRSNFREKWHFWLYTLTSA